MTITRGALENIRELNLAVALFFNPFGYNELFAYIMTRTGSYWRTAWLFYILSGVLFGTYFFLKFFIKRMNKT